MKKSEDTVTRTVNVTNPQKIGDKRYFEGDAVVEDAEATTLEEAGAVEKAGKAGKAGAKAGKTPKE